LVIRLSWRFRLVQMRKAAIRYGDTDQRRVEIAARQS